MLHSKEDVLSIISTQPKGNIEEFNFKKKFPELYQEVISIKFPSNFKWTQKLYHFFHNDIELKLGICLMCGKRCNFQTFGKGYTQYCSITCATSNSQRVIKTRKTCLEKYGVEHYSQTQECQEKMRQTCLEKYGVENYRQTDEYKERYKQTCLEKYGVEYHQQSENTKAKIKQTCLEKYGVENYAQTKECHEKMEQTCLEKYGVKNPSQSELIKENKMNTHLKRYGVPYYSQTVECKEKVKETCLEKYGVESYTQTKECHEKMKQTILKKYGAEHYTQTQEYQEKSKQTCLEKYGAEYYSQSDEYKENVDVYDEKRKQTCLSKYGVEHYSQTHESATKRKKRILYDNLMFDSNWEVIVYRYCKESNIPCVYQPNIQIKYVYDGKEHFYQPDFLINNNLYEIKGDHFFDGDKMICPFDRAKDGLFEAKHQCMLSNNVIILTSKDIEKLEVRN